MNRFICMLAFAIFIVHPAGAQSARNAPRENRPNIIWITIDDCGRDFACYGNTLLKTPNLDRLAAGGLQFTHAFTTTPVCSPARSGLIVGADPTEIGAHHHRSTHALPAGVRPVTDIFREHGYRSTSLPARKVQLDKFLEHRPPDASGFDTLTGKLKLDFNFNRGAAKGMFESWDPARKDEPFFAMIDFNPQKGPAGFVARYAERTGNHIDPAEVTIHPYWPDTPAMRQRVARYHEAITVLDDEIGRVLDWLDAEGLRENTMIFVWADHGMAFFRHKQWCYDSGLRVPLLIAGPGVDPAVRDDLVSSIDLAPTALAACGAIPPAYMTGRDLLDANVAPPRHLFAHRDRCDETEDRVRSVRDARFRLIHNLRPDLPWIGRNNYTRRAFLEVPLLIDAKKRGDLTPTQAIWLADRKPKWELYDLDADPLEIVNLADDPAFAQPFEQLKSALGAWETTHANVDPEPLAHIVPAEARREVERIRSTALVYEQPFEHALALEDFAFTDAGAWRFSEREGDGNLELFGASQYAPPHRSPRNIALIASHQLGDFVLEADLLQTGREYGHRDLCIFFGYQDPSHFYYAHIASIADDHAHNIFIVDGAARTKIAARTTEGVQWGTDVWRHIRVERTIDPPVVKLYFEDMTAPIMIAEDPRFRWGYVGFGSFDDTGRIDNIKVTAPGARAIPFESFTDE